jgi:acetyl esterase/lipase
MNSTVAPTSAQTKPHRRHRVLPWLAVAVLALPSVRGADAPANPEPPPAASRPKPTVADYAYGNVSPRQVLDFWQAKTAAPAPVVVLIHGGGWIRGDKSAYGTAAIQPYLDAGISVASISYRYIAQAIEEGVQPPVKACLEDAARAIQTIRFKAREWHLDPRRVAASGGSAGACSSLWLAFHDDMADPKSPDPVARESTRLTCAAVNAPQTSLDPLQLREWMPNSTYGAHAFGFTSGRWTAANFEELLRNREKVLPWIKEYSPMEHVSRDDPPVFLWFPKQVGIPTIGEPQPDPTHSAIFGMKLVEALNRVGVEAVISYPAAPDTRYGTMEKFIIAKLTNRTNPIATP